MMELRRDLRKGRATRKHEPSGPRRDRNNLSYGDSPEEIEDVQMNNDPHSEHPVLPRVAFYVPIPEEANKQPGAHDDTIYAAMLADFFGF
jgi:hypothetical protein